MRIIILLFAALLTGCASNSYTQREIPRLSEPATAVSLKALWQYEWDIFIKPAPWAPLVLDQRLFVFFQLGHVGVFDDEGKLVKRHEFSSDLSTRPAVTAEYIFATTIDGELKKLNHAFETQWSARLDCEAGTTPSLGYGLVVAYCHNGQVVALEQSTGEERWRFNTNPPALSLRGASAPILTNGGVIFGSANGKVIALVAENGQLAWEQRLAMPMGRSEIERIVDVDTQPVIAEQDLYVGSVSGPLSSLELRSGKTIWQSDISIASEIVVDSQLMLISDLDGRIRALDRRNGNPVWTQSDFEEHQMSSPLVVAQWVVVSDDVGSVHILDRSTGKRLFQLDLEVEVSTAKPVLFNNQLVFFTQEGRLVSYKIRSPS